MTSSIFQRPLLQRHWRPIWLVATLLLYLALTTYQLGLPGLHYDEAKEAGVNAVELLTGAPVTAFRGATLDVFGWQLPLMVQDYIGALNVYLAMPFLALTGIGVPNLRALSILTGLIALLLLERAISTYWWQVASSKSSYFPHSPLPISYAGLITLTLLVAAPSFIFWSRQGIFVTNLTQPLCFWCIWQGLIWLQTGRRHALFLSAFAGGLALYAKLLAVWIVGPFALLIGGWWIWQRWRESRAVPTLSWSQCGLMIGAFVIPLLPLILFNVQTGGTFESIFGNLTESYYGVNNSDIARNLPIRLAQLLQSLRGDHFWYLGGVYGNSLAPWLAIIAIVGGLLTRWRFMLFPLLLLVGAVSMSLFTVSDLFITHYALIQPLTLAVIGIGMAALNERLCRGKGQEGRVRFPNWRTAIVSFAFVSWLLLDVTASVRYHSALTESGGLADHAAETYDLAYFLRYNGMGAPVALDWGLDATVRFLSQGAVTPIEIFGYDSTTEPDADFVNRLQLFLPNTETVYLLRPPEQTVFTGRRAIFFAEASTVGLSPQRLQQFTQSDGVVLAEVWRLVP